MYDIQKIISDLKQIAAECEKVTSGNVSHRIANIEHGILNIADYLENYCPLGWHPASELPKLKDGEDDVDSIVILDGYGIKLPFHATYCRFTGWSHNNVKWWCYPPNED